MSRAAHHGLLLVLALATLAGCGGSPEPESVDLGPLTVDLTGVPLSDDLASHVRASAAAVRGAATPADSLLALRDSLMIAIRRPESRNEAGDRFYDLWAADPSSLVWIETAVRCDYLLRRSDELDARIDALAATADGAAAHAFGAACQEYGYGSRGEGFHEAERHVDGLAVADRLLIQRKLAMTEADAGRPLAAVQRMLAAVDESRTASRLLEMRMWFFTARYLLRADRLDDALHAAAAGARLLDEGGSPAWRGRYLILVGTIREARRETDEALAILRRASDFGRDEDLPWVFLDATDKAAALSSALGDPERALEFDRRTLAHSLSMSDSLNVPRNLMNIAYDHRLVGHIDSCLVYQGRARTWVEAYDDARNQAMLPFLEAETYCQLGQYDRVAELLSSAVERSSAASLAREEARLHVGLIRQGLEMDRPELAHRSVIRLQGLRDVLHDDTPDQNLAADFETATAEFYLGRGEYVLASEALDRARDAVASGGGEGTAWRLGMASGRLAQRRGDLRTARTEFRAALDTALSIGSPDQQASSRFHLGHALLESGRFDEARDLFRSDDDGGFGSGFRARLSSLVFLARSWNEEGVPDSTLVHVERADALITPFTPVDLAAGLRFESARALAASGRRHGGADEARRAARLLAGSEGAGSEELSVFNEHLRRDVAELEIALALDDGDADAALAAALGFLVAGEDGADRDVVGRIARGDAAQDLMVTFVGRDRSHAWRIVGGDVRRWDLPGRTGISDLVAPVLSDLSTPDRVPDVQALSALAQTVLGPVLAAPPAAGATLSIAADDHLRGLPWSALPIAAGGPVILDVFAVEEVQFRTDRRGAPGHVPLDGLLMTAGVDAAGDGSRDLALLHHAEREASAVADAWTGGPVVRRLGAEASWSNLMAAGLGEASIIHLATHATVVGGAGAVLQLAGDEPGESPSLRTIAETDLSAALVFLSCCEGTRRRHVGEGTSDLAGAFLRAGAGTVVASSLRVDDETALELAVAFYGSLAGEGDTAVALREAQRRVRDLDERRSHPYYWSFYRSIRSLGL